MGLTKTITQQIMKFDSAHYFHLNKLKASQFPTSIGLPNFKACAIKFVAASMYKQLLNNP